MGTLAYAAIAAAGLLAAACWLAWRRRRAVARRAEALESFDGLRTELEPEFLSAAGATGKPRGLRWTGCRLAGPATFAADRTTGDLYALVGVTVSFEAVAGGGMEEVEAVGNLRAATAVFVHRGGRWTTDGRVVFNLSPEAALAHYQESLELVPPSGA